MVRRSRTAISVEILRAALDGAKKTHIVYRANLNFEVANGYLDLLKEKGLIEQQGEVCMLQLKKEKSSRRLQGLGL
ncbi:MAG: winged helix-turn-helix domain-containing protein [Methanolobus sp.]